MLKSSTRSHFDPMGYTIKSKLSLFNPPPKLYQKAKIKLAFLRGTAKSTVGLVRIPFSLCFKYCPK